MKMAKEDGMVEQSGFKLSGRAPEMYEHYIVPTISAASAQELVTLAAQVVGPTGEVTGRGVRTEPDHGLRNLFGRA
jgi:hypothetical protein